MLKLTDEQYRELHSYWMTNPGLYAGIDALVDAYHAMLNASQTHRVVEAPEGYCFDESCGTLTARYGFREPYIQLAMKPIPKPCPPPKLEPVTVTVTPKQVYGTIPHYPAGYEVEFGNVDKLADEGFTEAIGLNGERRHIRNCVKGANLICLRKWEPR